MKRMIVIAIILLMMFTTVFSYASTEDVSSVYEKTSNEVPNTSTGCAAPYTLTSYVVNEQWVEDLTIDKGIVHKSVYVFSSLSTDRVGTLITDISVRGNGNVVKNEGVFIPPTQQYPWSY